MHPSPPLHLDPDIQVQATVSPTCITAEACLLISLFSPWLPPPPPQYVLHMSGIHQRELVNMLTVSHHPPTRNTSWLPSTLESSSNPLLLHTRLCLICLSNLLPHCSSCFSPTSLFLEYTELFPAPGPLHLLFPLPG